MGFTPTTAVMAGAIICKRRQRQSGKLDTYEDDDWRHAIEKGSYITGLIHSGRRKERYD